MNAYILPGGATEDTAQAAIRWYKGAAHTAVNVHGEMLLQIVMDYSCLPPIDSMTLADLVYFYEGRRQALKESTKPK